jgi:hypothetical protein
MEMRGGCEQTESRVRVVCRPKTRCVLGRRMPPETKPFFAFRAFAVEFFLPSQKKRGTKTGNFTILSS